MGIKAFVTALVLMYAVPAQAVHIVSKSAHIDITTDKVQHIIGTVDGGMFNRFGQEGMKTLDLPGPRVVIINSGGGSVDAGNAMLRLLLLEKNASGNQLICVVTGEANSMAFNILSFCDVKLATPKSTMFVHKAALYGMDDGKFRWTAKNLRRAADDLEAADEPFRQRNASQMHMSLEDYDLLADMETECTAEGLVQRHYLDGLVELAK